MFTHVYVCVYTYTYICSKTNNIYLLTLCLASIANCLISDEKTLKSLSDNEHDFYSFSTFHDLATSFPGQLFSHLFCNSRSTLQVHPS